MDSAGNLFVADTDNRLMRRVDAATQAMSVVAGGGSTYSEDGFATAVSLIRSLSMWTAPETCSSSTTDILMAFADCRSPLDGSEPFPPTIRGISVMAVPPEPQASSIPQA